MNRKDRIIGFFDNSNKRDCVRIYDHSSVREGQRVSVYIPTAQKVIESDTNKVMGYRNKCVGSGIVKAEGKRFVVEIPSVNASDLLTKEVRKCRKFSKGDVIIKILSEE